MVSFTPRLFYPQGTNLWYSLNSRMDGLQSHSSQSLPGFEPPTIQLVAQRYTTELYRLLVVNMYQWKIMNKV
jgi:hypothetical protein